MRAAGEQLELGVEVPVVRAAIPLQAALEAGALVLRGVDAQLVVGQPVARRDLGRRRHVRRHRLRHALVAGP